MNFTAVFTTPTENEIFYSVGVFLFVFLGISVCHYFIKRHTEHSELFQSTTLLFLTMLMAVFSIFVKSALSPLILSLVTMGIVFGFKISGKILKQNCPLFLNRVLFLFAYFAISVLLFWEVNRHVLLYGLLILLIAQFLIFLMQRGERGSGERLVCANEINGYLKYVMYFFLATLTLNFLLFYFRLFEFPLHIFNIFSLVVVLAVIFCFYVSGVGDFILPFSSAILLVMFLHFNREYAFQFSLGVVFALIIGVLSYKARFLSLSGALMTFLLATFIYGLGGWAWTVPILTFFILSSILSKLGRDQKQKFKNTFEKTGVRDYAQVLANGAIPGILVILHFFWPLNLFYYLYLLSLAIAAADTWSTELGVLSPKRPILITTLKPVEPGISGAISFLGTVGGLLGALLVILSGMFFRNINVNQFMLLLFFSLVGDFLDSLIGATLQGQYQCSVCRKYTEKTIHCSQPTKLIQGFNFINNDTVNISANLIALIIYGIFILQ